MARFLRLWSSRPRVWGGAGLGVELPGQGAETIAQVGQLERVESGCASDLRLNGHGRSLEVMAELGRGNYHLAAVGAAATAYETGDL